MFNRKDFDTINFGTSGSTDLDYEPGSRVENDNDIEFRRPPQTAMDRYEAVEVGPTPLQQPSEAVMHQSGTNEQEALDIEIEDSSFDDILDDSNSLLDGGTQMRISVRIKELIQNRPPLMTSS